MAFSRLVSRTITLASEVNGGYAIIRRKCISRSKKGGVVLLHGVLNRVVFGIIRLDQHAARPVRRVRRGRRPASAIGRCAPRRENPGMLSEESAVITPTSVTR